MKKSALILATVICASCTRSIGTGEGRLRLEVKPDARIEESTKAQVSDFAHVPTAAEFDLTIKNGAGETAWQGKFSEWNPETKLAKGTFNATATYGDPEKEGKELPYFVASENFEIIAFETTPLTLTPKLGNCIVKIKKGEFLSNYFKTASFSIKTGAGNEMADIKEGDAIFMDAFKFTLTGTFTTYADKGASITKTFEGLDAAKCYTVTIDAENVDKLNFIINFNDNIETISSEEELN